ncbi:MAG: arsenate reductase family protein [Spirochaetales bacterium]|nr:arsenate reductase family protein [Spirochaetales bacterium]
MSKNTVYHYPKCSTCKKALKWLDENQVVFTPLHIVEESPDAATLKSLIEKSGLPFKKFFNTSGMKYRQLGLKDKLPTMTLAEAVELLASDGMLIKRPLLIKGDKVLVGFKVGEWEEGGLK